MRDKFPDLDLVLRELGIDEDEVYDSMAKAWADAIRAKILRSEEGCAGLTESLMAEFLQAMVDRKVDNRAKEHGKWGSMARNESLIRYHRRVAQRILDSLKKEELLDDALPETQEKVG